MFKIFAIVSLFVSFSAAADHHGKSKECNGIRSACESAGFKLKGHKEGKGLIVDCMGKIAKGEAVEGVTVDPTTPENKACIEHLTMKKEMMKERHAGKHGMKHQDKPATGEGGH